MASGGSVGSSAGPTPKVPINRKFVLKFFELFNLPEFQVEHTPSDVNVKDCLKWVMASELPVAKEIVLLGTLKSERRARKGDDEITSGCIFPSTENATLRELGTQQVRQTMRLALSAYNFNKVDRRFKGVFLNTFKTHGIPIGFCNGGNYIQTVLKDARKEVIPGYMFQTPSTSEILVYFHCLRHVNILQVSKKLSIRRNYLAGDRIGVCVQLLCMALSTLLRAAGLPPFSESIQPYILFEVETGMYRVLTNRSDGYAPVSQRRDYVGNAIPVKTSAEVSPSAWKRSDDVDSALRTVTDHFFESLHAMIGNNQLYQLEKKEVMAWPPLQRCRLSTFPSTSSGSSNLPLVFSSLPDNVASALHIQVPVSPSQKIIDVDTVSSDPEITPVTGKVATEGSKDVSTGGNNSRGRGESLGGKLGKRKLSRAVVQRDTDRDTGRRRVTQHLTPTEGASSTPIQDPLPVPADTVPASARPTRPVEIKEEPVDVLDMVTPATSLDLDESAQAAFSTLQEAMKSVCTIYNCSFNELLDTHETFSGQDLHSRVNMVMTDPPYNVRNVRNEEASPYDVLTEEDMEEFVELISDVLDVGCHGHVFCSFLQFAYWYNLLVSRKEAKDSESISGHSGEEGVGDEEEEAGELMFEVEAKPLIYSKIPGNYNSDPRVRRLHHTSMCEAAIHFWRKGLPAQAMLNRVDYDCPKEIPTRYPGWTNDMDNIPRLLPAEIIKSGERSDNGRETMLRPEQKNVLWIKDVLAKFTVPGDLVLDSFAGTLSTAKACLLFDKHRRFIGCEKDRNCIQKSMPSLVETYARQILNKDSDIEGSQDLQKAAKILLNAVDSINAKRRADVWGIHKSLYPMQTFPKQMLHYLTNLFGDPWLFQNCRLHPLPKWPLKWRSRFNSCDVQQLRAVEANYLGLMVKKSSILHHDAGVGVFATRHFGLDEEVGYFYGTLVYSDVRTRILGGGIYGEGHLAVNADRFQKYSLRVPHRVVMVNGSTADVWVVPAPFCVMGLINDPRYRQGDETNKEVMRVSPRQANVKFTATYKARSPSDFKGYALLSVTATRNIAPGDELFVHYGSDYMFKSAN